MASTSRRRWRWPNNCSNSAPLVIGALKRLVAQVLPVGPVERMVEISQTLARVRQSEDMQEGISAYREKRKPNFRGR